MTETRIHTFRLLLSGPTDDTTAETLMDACGDMLLSADGGRLSADFDRRAVSLEDAVLSAIHDLESTSADVLVERVEPDDLVTAAAIAERIGRTRQSVALLITGDRGPGGFPRPLSFVDGKSRVWRWAEVAEWFEQNSMLDDETTPSARDRRFLAAINGALEARLNLRAYRASGGDDGAASTVRQIANGGSTDVGVAAIDSGGEDVTLRTGIELLELAREVLADAEMHVTWMEASVAGFSRALRVHLTGNDVDASPFEELVAEGMTHAALCKMSHHGSARLFPASDFDAYCRPCDAKLRKSRFLGSPSRYRPIPPPDERHLDFDLRTVLVNGLQASEQVVNRITVWISLTDIDHIRGLGSLLVSEGSSAEIVTLNWDQLFADVLADESTPASREHVVPRSYGLWSADQYVRAQHLTRPQRLWATTWSFGQTLRLYTEEASPRQVETVSAALKALERIT